MQKLVLYIKNNDGVFKRMDMFEDETVTLTSKIQDIRDVGKIFTDYSKSFTLPPSKENNKLFQHYYNESIENGFDARSKKDAILELDFLPFRKGKIFLDSVTMKNNQVFAYNITFFGNTVSLKDLLGDDELSILDSLDDDFTHNYNSAQVKTGIQSGLFSQSIIYPLITHTKRLYYDSDDTSVRFSGSASSTSTGKLVDNTKDFTTGVVIGDVVNNLTDSTTATVTAIDNSTTLSLSSDIMTSGENYEIIYYSGFSGNLFHNSSVASTTQGLAFDDVKPAIKCLEIIEAIEIKYNIEFTRDFFGSTAFSNLYLWLSRNKGPIGGDENQEQLLTRICGDWGFASGDLGEFTVSGDTWTATAVAGSASFSATLDITSTGTYSVKAIDYNTGNILGQVNNITGNGQLDIELFNPATYKVKFIIESTDVVSFTPELSLEKVNYSTSPPTVTNAVYDINGTGDSISTISEILITENVPKIKIIDFLTGIFKTFNLTAYYVTDAADADYEKIYVDTLDNYYADAVNNPSGGTTDITKYVNISNTEIRPTTLFTEINFRYQDPSTLLSINHEEQFNDVFGDEEFKPVGVDRGTPYTIELPFEHMKYERLFDDNEDASSPYSGSTPAYMTDILWGYSAEGDFDSDTGDYEPVLTKPLIFYAIRENISTEDKAINWISDTPDYLLYYFRPSNTNEDGTSSVAPTYTLNFDNEVDEWNLTDYDGDTNSLFKKFYATYINDAFNVYKRTYKLKAKFPSDFLINYRLNDVLIIQDKQFTINSITTNLKDGTSDLELLIKL